MKDSKDEDQDDDLLAMLNVLSDDAKDNISDIIDVLDDGTAVSEVNIAGPLHNSTFKDDYDAPLLPDTATPMLPDTASVDRPMTEVTPDDSPGTVTPETVLDVPTGPVTSIATDAINCVFQEKDQKENAER